MPRKLIATLTLTTTAAATLVLATGPADAAAGSADASPSGAASGVRPAASAPYRITPFRPTADDDPRLVRAWRAWQARDDHRRYTTVVSTLCFCPPGTGRTVETVVRGKRVTSVTYVDGTRELDRRGYEMAAVYRLLRRAYATADELDVRYRNGVPRAISIDRISGAVDDEVFYSVQVRTQG